MALQATLFQMIMVVVAGLVAFTGYVLVKQGKYKLAGVIAVLWLLLILFAPIRMTTNTSQYNAKQVERYTLDAQKNFREIAPRVTVERESYDAKLRSTSDQLKSNTPTVE